MMLYSCGEANVDLRSLRFNWNTWYRTCNRKINKIIDKFFFFEIYVYSSEFKINYINV